MTRRFEGKVAVVTGGATGIGLATAKRFAEEGARVFITGRRETELKAAARAIGPSATAVVADSANLNDLDRLHDQVKKDAGTGTIGTPALSVYSASKAAVRNFARTWTQDLKARGIRVNVVSPGATKTPGLYGLAPSDPASQQALAASLTTEIPMGRMGEPDEVASAVLFPASKEASFVIGVELFVDGGTAQV